MLLVVRRSVVESAGSMQADCKVVRGLVVLLRREGTRTLDCWVAFNDVWLSNLRIKSSVSKLDAGSHELHELG